MIEKKEDLGRRGRLGSWSLFSWVPFAAFLIRDLNGKTWAG
jgi:hypothetical protein